MATNPRNKNGARRKAIRKWVLATYDNCAICGKPVDKSLKTPDPMSAEVDEIIPVSRGGDPLDKSNVQLAHRICNQRKGNKMPWEMVEKKPEKKIKNSRDWGL